MAKVIIWGILPDEDEQPRIEFGEDTLTGKAYLSINGIEVGSDGEGGSRNLQAGTGSGAVEQIPDEVGAGIDFKDKNSNAAGLDNRVWNWNTGNTLVPYGARGNFSVSLNGYSSAQGDYSTTYGEYTIALGRGAYAMGNASVAIGNYSRAEGLKSTAFGDNSHAEGYQTTAKGQSSHVEGSGCTATGSGSHAEGVSTESIGLHSHAEGGGTKSLGDNSHSEGMNTKSYGGGSHAEGHSTEAGTEDAVDENGNSINVNAYAAHAEGGYSKATGMYSHAQGTRTHASGTASHASGSASSATGFGMHAMGVNTQTYQNYENLSDEDQAKIWGQTVVGRFNVGRIDTIFEVGIGDDDERKNGLEVYADGQVSVPAAPRDPDNVLRLQDVRIRNGVEGENSIQQESKDSAGFTYATGNNPNALGVADLHKNDSGKVAGFYNEINSWVNGTKVPYGAYNKCSVVLGGKGYAKGSRSLALGTGTMALGDYSVTEGNTTVAMGSNSHAMGRGSTAYGEHSLATGEQTIAEGNYSASFGSATKASGDGAVALGSGTEASGDFSVSMGYKTKASLGNMVAIGHFNKGGRVRSGGIQTLFEIGNGDSSLGESGRSNAFEVLTSGEVGILYQGKLYSLHKMLYGKFIDSNLMD